MTILFLFYCFWGESGRAGVRQYFVTTGGYTGAFANTICANDGFHVCAPGEWFGKKYNNSLGAANPTTSWGWVDAGPGTNCSSWTSTAGNADVMQFNSGSVEVIQHVGSTSCASTRPVWCCQD